MHMFWPSIWSRYPKQEKPMTEDDEAADAACRARISDKNAVKQAYSVISDEAINKRGVNSQFMVTKRANGDISVLYQEQETVPPGRWRNVANCVISGDKFK